MLQAYNNLLATVLGSNADAAAKKNCSTKLVFTQFEQKAGYLISGCRYAFLIAFQSMAVKVSLQKILSTLDGKREREH